MAQLHGRNEDERGWSPPTDRVVTIVELLAAQDHPSSVAAIASRLELNRSTVTSILLALERAGWVIRQSDRKYALGPGLIGVSEAVRRSPPLSAECADAVEQLAQRTGCAAALASVGNDELRFLAVVHASERIPAGIGVGTRLPLTAPVGVAVMAHRDRIAQRRWLASAQPGASAGLDAALSQVRRSGVAVFGLGDANPQTLDLLAEVVELLAAHPRREALRQRVFGLLASLNGNPYTTEQLATSQGLSVNYLAAPVFTDGEAVYELQLGPLRDAVSAADRERYIREISATAATLSSV